MIRGVVNARREAVPSLRVRDQAGGETALDAVIDTGYSGTLTVPPGVVAALVLPRRLDGRAVLADGSERSFPTYAAEVEWDGRWLPMVVSALGDESLVGMTLLAGHKLETAVEPGGSVEIRPL